ncbi:hypothetical protein Tmel_0395 [Thermosipho melanesiensis BI429]|uniref:Uncharacterized protein n=2 Tax=Thermosipho melanesiensis TaxID=46541 RepID=A6LK13_THEM4|nr:hypothetical protein Tmel_0395 [Thermosipho melanesiensis BI429]
MCTGNLNDIENISYKEKLYDLNTQQIYYKLNRLNFQSKIIRIFKNYNYAIKYLNILQKPEIK